MRWIPDTTRRALKRPFYERRELNDLAETHVAAFLQQRHGQVHYPLSTEDLGVLVEQETSDLDLYADLTSLSEAVEGVTLFPAGTKPVVRISQHLGQVMYQNRQRTTLAHELGHVLLHANLWPHGQASLFGGAAPHEIHCTRNTVLRAPESDWLEWQAGFFSGALLMPLSAMLELLGPQLVPQSLKTDTAEGWLAVVQNAFLVSHEAAQVRLLQLGFLTEIPQPMSLFDHQDGII